ncbi:MAG: DUF4062 domain-containing protein [Deltaproteobacteria bacterium]|nr:DUF4062 domain-containing protein [Deltaproteobacteria bacterium]
MDKRYQVFVSSTFDDLKVERLEVMKSIVEMDCFPCGMEYFPASNLDQWSYIKILISQCDYYVVVIAGRYGSTDENGISYTEKEYDYAVAQKIPTIAFIHSAPEKLPFERVETKEENRRKLEIFKQKTKKRLCKFWATPHELGGVLSRSLQHLIKTNERPGWLRANEIPEIVDRERLEELSSLVQEKDETISHLNYGLSECLKSKKKRKKKHVYDVFIAYSSRDAKVAVLISKKLSEKGIRAFLSEKSIRPGDVWDDVIRESLINSSEIVVICSRDSLRSNWLNTELGAAWALSKRITPITYQVSIEELPSQLARFQVYDFSAILDDNWFFEEMVERLEDARDA